MEKTFKFLNRIGLKNKDFTIISDNCWGGFIYDYFSMQYKSPFINLFLFPHCYVELLRDFEQNMASELEFIDPNRSKYVKQIPDINTVNMYPIGVIRGNIEIHFLHYRSENDANIKWQERKKRINRNNMLIKFCDRLVDTPDIIRQFDELPFKHKVCFTTKPYPYKSATIINDFNIKKYLNDMNSLLGCTSTSPPVFSQQIRI